MSDDDRDIDIESDVSLIFQALEREILVRAELGVTEIHVCLSLASGGRRLRFEARALQQPTILLTGISHGLSFIYKLPQTWRISIMTLYHLQAEKRAHHNALERKRRDHIKDSFSSLRDSVPSLQGEKVASRAQILKKAAEYIQFMRRKNTSHQQDIDDLKRQNNLLESQSKCHNCTYNDLLNLILFLLLIQ